MAAVPCRESSYCREISLYSSFDRTVRECCGRQVADDNGPLYAKILFCVQHDLYIPAEKSAEKTVQKLEKYLVKLDEEPQAIIRLAVYHLFEGLGVKKEDCQSVAASSSILAADAIIEERPITPYARKILPLVPGSAPSTKRKLLSPL